ncbi:MAG: CotH kinase family protein [Spirochaetaceae bacterium]|nr:CotH kinase family protein [Spirochaetaceae bacterium]
MIGFVELLLSGCPNSNHSDEPEVIKGYVDPDTLNTGLPIIKINTKNNQPITSKETYIPMDIQIIDPLNSGNDLELTSSNEEMQGIRGRGNSTWGHPKKPYRLKFDKKQSLFGLQKAKSWVLLANYQDPTLLMNTIAFELGQSFGLPFTNHYIHVDLVLNGVYEGSYVLTEQVQVGEGRVDIDEDDGFLVELDTYYDEEPKFKTDLYTLPVMIKSPEDLDEPAGYDFVKMAINDLEAAVKSDTFPDNEYRDLIDMDTFVDFLLINEIVGNIELMHPKSIYIYKDKDDAKISMGPLWDFDWAFGYSGSGHTYFNAPKTRSGRHAFFQRFYDDPVFRGEYKEHWNDNYSNITAILSFIDAMAVKLDKSQQANYRVWQWSDGLYYQQEIAKMKTWLTQRIMYLNEEINKY